MNALEGDNLCFREISINVNKSFVVLLLLLLVFVYHFKNITSIFVRIFLQFGLKVMKTNAL